MAAHHTHASKRSTASVGSAGTEEPPLTMQPMVSITSDGWDSSATSTEGASISVRAKKVLVTGDAMVGKTSLLDRYAYFRWTRTYKPTLGTDYAVKMLRWSDTESVRLHLWDIAGQEHFRAMTRTYFRGASGCVIMFDITNRSSFEHAKVWKDDLDAKVALPSGEPVPCILLANKDDLENKAVSSQEIAKFAKDNGFFYWSAVSVKENRGITDSMNHLIRKMLQHEYDSGTIQQAEDKDVVVPRGSRLLRPKCCSGGGADP